jgi:hypothetical protein
MAMTRTASLPLAQARQLPIWRGPIALLVVMAAAMPLSFASWSALLNNFVIEAAGFTGVEIGWLHTVREIPGFLAVGVILVIRLMREQVLALVSLAALGLGTAIVAHFPSFGGLLLTTMISSIGFHYYETVNQSLQLQWIDKARAPQVLGWLVAVGSGAAFLAYGGIYLYGTLAERAGASFDYASVYAIAGGATLALTAYCALAFRQFEAPTPQTRRLVLRRRYWLYYVLQFLSGARRQIFVVFAAFMMVERFGFAVHDLTALFLINFAANMLFAPLMGRAVGRFGERAALMFEYAGLIFVFLAYGGVYWLGWGIALAATLYVIDHLFFALAFALKTYFQKIADPADIAPTAAVAFTINHIAAVFLPAALGYLWIAAPGGVFLLAAAIAGLSLMMAALIPRHPEPGHETVLSAMLRPTGTA